MHTVSFSLAFYIVLRPQGIRKQIKTLRKRHRVHIALVFLLKEAVGNLIQIILCLRVMILVPSIWMFYCTV